MRTHNAKFVAIASGVARRLLGESRQQRNLAVFRRTLKMPANSGHTREFFQMTFEPNANPYSGPERRQHRVYVTRNTEYHFRGQTCLAVRDRKTGHFLPSHLAIQRTLSGGVRYQANGSAVPSCAPPQVGEALYFGDDGRELVTSLCARIERPERRLVESYPAP